VEARLSSIQTGRDALPEREPTPPWEGGLADTPTVRAPAYVVQAPDSLPLPERIGLRPAERARYVRPVARIRGRRVRDDAWDLVAGVWGRLVIDPMLAAGSHARTLIVFGLAATGLAVAVERLLGMLLGR